MLPSLAEGDCLLVLHGGPVRPGRVVVGRLAGRPDLLVVKRAGARLEGGWLLTSDATAEPGAVSGPGEALAVVLLRYWPLRRAGRVPGAPPPPRCP